MLSKLEHLDWALSMAVNAWNAPWADRFMRILSATSTWILFYVFLVAVMACRYKKNMWVLALALVMLVGLADWTSVHFFKNVFMRLRPCCEPRLFELYSVHGYARVKNAVQYGFISSHAANCFAIAAYVSLALKGTSLKGSLIKMAKTPTVELETELHAPQRPRFFAGGLMYGWAALIGYSRVYLAKHYVGDVVCGAVWGIIIAYFVWWLTRLTLAKVCPSAYRYPFRQRKK